jgi:hypothetical protein
MKRNQKQLSVRPIIKWLLVLVVSMVGTLVGIVSQAPPAVHAHCRPPQWFYQLKSVEAPADAPSHLSYWPKDVEFTTYDEHISLWTRDYVLGALDHIAGDGFVEEVPE